MKIGFGRGTGKFGVNVHDDRVSLVLGFHNPFERNGVVFGSITAHYQDGIGIFNVDPVVGHRAASKRLSQSRYSCAVSDTGLMVHVYHTKAAHGLMGKGTFLVIGVGSAKQKHGFQPVDGVAFFVF